MLSDYLAWIVMAPVHRHEKSNFLAIERGPHNSMLLQQKHTNSSSFISLPIGTVSQKLWKSPVHVVREAPIFYFKIETSQTLNILIISQGF